ncbi:MAG: hypothetical protein JOZ80_14515 [Acidobacteriaceae bacterium]|nr:hypothetical protein [Acidobacteriaceae bacterium]
MSLVRIIGEQQAAEGLAQQLRARDFETEIIAAGTPSSSAAHLEIALEECSLEEVLDKAMAILAQERDACLVVAPDIILPAARTKEENRSATAADIEVPPNVKVAEGDSDLASVGGLVPPCSEQEPGDIHVTSIFDLFDNAEVGPPLPQQENKHAVEHCQLQDATLLNQAPTQTDSDSLTQRQNDRQATSVDSQVARESIADTGSDWPIWQLANEQAPSSNVSLQTQIPERNATYKALFSSARQFMNRASNAINFNDRRFVRIATVTAALAAVALLFTSTFHRFSPLPAHLLNGSSLSSQPVPFHNVEAGTTAADGSSPAPHPSLSASAKVQAPQVSANSAKVPKTSSAAARVTSEDAGLIAKNTVVRYGVRSETRHIFGEPRQAGVKYYSDLSPTR